MRQVDLAAPLRGHGLPHPGTHMAGWGRSRSLDEVRLTRIRRRQIGFVFQSFNLLPTLTAVENTALPLMLDGVAPDIAKRKATGLLERVGLRHRLGHYPQQLSEARCSGSASPGRYATPRCWFWLTSPPGIWIPPTAPMSWNCLRDLNRSLGVTVLLATHSAEMAAASQRSIAHGGWQDRVRAAGFGTRSDRWSGMSPCPQSPALLSRGPC